MGLVQQKDIQRHRTADFANNATRLHHRSQRFERTSNKSRVAFEIPLIIHQPTMTVDGLVLPSINHQIVARVVGANDLENAPPRFIELVAGIGKQASRSGEGRTKLPLIEKPIIAARTPSWSSIS